MKNFLLLLFICSYGFSQDLNNYKYASVPSKFSFMKDNNMYGLNILSKFYMEKYGFETYINNENAPDDFIINNCNKVYVDLVTNNNIFLTRLKIVLKDCKGNVLATSTEGSSREKEYRVAYNEALRYAFDNFNVLKSHKYQPTEKSTEIVSEALAVKSEVKTDSTVKDVNLNDKESTVGETTSEELRNRLSVVATEMGFDLYNIESKLIYSAKRTSLKNVYIASSGVEHGIIKKDYNDTWYFEYYREGSKKLISEPLNFKF